MIAISYRREDSLPIAGRLYDRLQSEFGKGKVFMDFDSIPYGVDFREHIKQMLDDSKVLLALIGPGWFGKGKQRARRIDDPADFIRLEIAYAFERGIPVIPVLINNTPMPKAKDLPPEIENLAFRNALTLDVGLDFHHHTDRLIAGINRLIIETARSIARKGQKLETPPPIEKPPLPAKPSSSQQSTTRRESSAGLFRESELIEPGAMPTPPGISNAKARTAVTDPFEGLDRKSSTAESPKATRLSAQHGSFQRERWRMIPLEWARITAGLSKRRNLIYGASLLLSIIVVTAIWYFGFRWTKQTRRESEADSFVEHAMKLREQEIEKSTSRSTPFLPKNMPSGAVSYSEADVDRIIKQVNALHDSNELAASTYRLDEAIKLDPSNVAALAEKALLCESRQQSELAGGIWWKIYAIGPSSGSLYDFAESKLRGRLRPTPLPSPTSTAALAPSVKDIANSSDKSLSIRSSESVATGSPSGRDNRTWQARIGEFVQQFVAANQLRDVDANLAFYGLNVDYFDDGQKDQAYIRQDVAKYNERWPIRRDAIEGEVNLQEKEPDKKYAASFKLDFYAESPDRAEWSKGQFALDLDISVVNGVPNISGIKEKVVRQQKGKINSTVPAPSNAISSNEKLFAGKWKGTEHVIATGYFKHSQSGDHSYTIDVNLSENTVVLSGSAGSRVCPVTNRQQRSITWRYKDGDRHGTGTMTLSPDGKTATVKHALRDNYGSLNSAGTYQKLK